MIIEAVTLSLEHFITISLIYPSASGRFYLISWAKIGQIEQKLRFLSKMAAQCQLFAAKPDLSDY